MYINQEGMVAEYRERLLEVSGDAIRTAAILKEVSGADTVELLCHRREHNDLYDLIRQNTYHDAFLTQETSLLGAAYTDTVPVQSSPVTFDNRYNVALDNPFKLTLSAQILIPILDEGDTLRGIVRFSKARSFASGTFLTLYELREAFAPIFSEKKPKKIEIVEAKFSLTAHDVYAAMGTITDAVSTLHDHVIDPEIAKLISNMQEDIDSLYAYLDTDLTPLEHHDAPQETPKGLHILIADDVKMNVKILNALVSNTSQDIAQDLSIDYAYDGLETMEKLKALETKEDDAQVDLLFLDHYMPGKLGLEIAQAVRAHEAKHPEKKIILISITNDPDVLKDEKHLFDYHLCKPFSKAEVAGIMQNIRHKYLQPSQIRT